VGDIGEAVRITEGVSQPVTLTAGKIALLLFDPVAGQQQASVTIGNGTFSQCTLYLFDPFGTQLGSTGCAGSSGFLDSVRSNKTATYTVGVDPGSSSGSMNIIVNNSSDITGAITPGIPINFVTTAPGQNVRYTFTGTQGQLASVEITNSTYPGCVSMRMSILDPIGNVVGTNIMCDGSGFLDSQTLPANGVYTVLLDPTNGGTGSGTVLLSTYNDISGTITPGTPINFTTSIPGQNLRYTFTGTQGQLASVEITNSTYPGCASMRMSILDPVGNVVGTNIMCDGSGFLDSQTLPANGTYTVLLDPTNGGTGSGTVLLSTYNDISGTITIGTPVNVGTASPGQNARLTFSGTTGESVSLALTSSTYSGCVAVNVSIVNPDGTNLASVGLCGSSGNISSRTLESTGIYTVLIDPQGVGTGSITVQLNSP
jgi:hypothetical protein